jgi:phage terminase large subunit-like protein
MTTAEEQKLEYLKALEAKLDLQQNLPHLYGWKWYKWARAFFESTNRYNFLVAANQISKSSTQIRKCIHWATEPEVWKIWPTRPSQFWYFYPSYSVITSEIDEKWIKEFLPRGKYKDDPKYGWEYVKKPTLGLYCLKFKSGVTVYFKSYEQSTTNLQTSSVHAMFVDEELPEELFSELNARISSASIQGHFHMVFTATLGQSFWRETMEEKGDAERFKKAFKLNVSMYDCLEYDDGSKSLWTKKIINDIKASCKSEAEIQRRVYGRFVVDDDLKYQEFVRARHLIKAHPLPKSWLIFVGVDLGSGGTRNHPAAITFIGVRPDFKEARVFLGWRGDNISTTAGDVLQQFQRMKARMKPVAQYYDWAAKDFHTMASRVGEPFQAAEKGHELGEQVLNVLFKNDMLKIYDTPELRKLANEFEIVRRSQDKTKAKDDFIDSLRYAVTKIPWDFTDLSRRPGHIKKLDAMTEREKFYKGDKADTDTDGLDLIESEFDEANEAYEYYRDEAFG